MMLSIRARLTLWYIAVLTIVLLAFAAGVYAFVGAEERAAVDRILRERAESFERAYNSESAEQSSEKAVLEVARDFARGEGDVLVYDAKGKVIFRSPTRLLHGTPAIDRGIVTIDGVRCMAAHIGSYVFVSTESLAGRRDALRRLRRAFMILIPLALIIAGFGGSFLAGKSLAPLNAALLALERSVQQQKQLLADTSHELRTPVTIIRSEAEVTLSRERDAEEYRHALDVIRSESAHLTNLIEGVLLLARADAQQGRISNAPLQLATVIQESVNALQRVATSRQIALTCSTDGPMPMRGNSELLRRMLLNLLDNSIKFTEAGGSVRLDSHRTGPNYVINVSDTGPGIPFGAQEKIFDRFFRADTARVRDNHRHSDGTGLGLPIARWIARAHGGDLRLVRSSPSGSIFEAVLPIGDVAPS
jgi:two-component system, OmpR family, sensor kinase